MNIRRISADFVGEPGRRIFILGNHPDGFDGRCVLACPPFAEEMNKSRKMLTELAKQLCSRGMALVIPDLFGTGDSDGDFAAADWQRWQQDLVTTESWIAGMGWQVAGLLGVRTGALLAAQHAEQRSSAVATTVFWQPTLDGARVLEQFLRIRVAASLMSDKQETSAELKARFAANEIVEVAGYGVAPLLAQGLGSQQLSRHAPEKLGKLHWFEIVRANDAPMPVAATRLIDRWQHQLALETTTITGEPFWGATEIVCIPELLSRTVNAFSGEPHHG